MATDTTDDAAAALVAEANSRLADALAALHRAAECARQLARTLPPHRQEAWRLVGARIDVTKRHLAGVLDPVGVLDDAAAVGLRGGRAHYARK